MKIQIKGSTKIISDLEIPLLEIPQALSAQYKNLKSWNLVLDLSGSQNLKAKDLSQFSAFTKQHNKNGKSFVIVASSIDFTAVPSAIHAVPTIGEAHDLIEMDEIERDLGF